MNFPASPRRLREARERGEVAHSPLLTTAGALAAAALAMAFSARPSAARVLSFAARAWSGRLAAAAAMGEAARLLAATVLPVAAAALAGGLAAGVLQTRGLFAPRALGRKEARDHSPALGLAATVAGTLLLVSAGRPFVASIARAENVRLAVAATVTTLAGFALRGVVLFALAGVADYARRRGRLAKRLSMTRAEVEAERKESEIDPRLRAEQRRRQRSASY